jgi:hypothetical protein
MRMMLPRALLGLGLVLAVTACGGGDKDVTLTRLQKPGEGPDEFLITPGKPLQEPESYDALPDPAPGAPNRTDRDPKAEGIAALGGNANATARGGVPQSDAGLVRHASRFGRQPGIRQTLRAEDERIRRAYGKRNLLRIGPRDDYTDAYEPQWLDAQAERRRLQRAGIATPAAPPPTD